MNENVNWHPSAKEIASAEQLLANVEQFQTRLRIVQALKSNPDAPLKLVARAANTRTAVVEAFMERWRECGLGSVTEFGRPKDLSHDQQNKLRTQLMAGRLKSLDQVRKHIKQKFGLKFDLRSIRSYCERFGFSLPATSNRRSVSLHESWSEANIAKLAGANKRLKDRLTAIIRACNKCDLPLRKIAEGDEQQWAPESTLRADLKAIKPNTTLEGFMSRRRRIPWLDRLNLRQVFYNWATERHASNGRSPSARDVVEFLKTEHRVKIAEKTAYSYLDEWKSEAKIGTRKYQRREKFVPSEGLAVRSIF